MAQILKSEKNKEKIEHWPTLNTVIMVENVLKNIMKVWYLLLN